MRLKPRSTHMTFASAVQASSTAVVAMFPTFSRTTMYPKKTTCDSGSEKGARESVKMDRPATESSLAVINRHFSNVTLRTSHVIAPTVK